VKSLGIFYIKKLLHSTLSIQHLTFFSSKMSLANKYRSKTFDEIIGQEHITEILKAQMRSDKEMHHNFLLF
jgi:replication-associated recombination protein RarA